MKQPTGRRRCVSGAAFLVAAFLLFAVAVPAGAGEPARLASKSAVSGRRTTPPVQAPTSRPVTALQFAAVQGLTYSDRTTFVLLESGNLRLRIYPGSDMTVVGGHEYRVKDPFVRSAGDVVLTGRVRRFLSRQVSAFRTEEAERRQLQASPPPALPPLPAPRHHVRRTPLPTHTAPAPAAKPTMPRPSRTHNEWVPRAPERPWKWIVIHHSDDMRGNMAKYDNYHRNVRGWENGCGYHFVIGNGSLSGDGEVEIGPRWPVQLQGAHAKVPGNRFNERGIGICLVGDFNSGSHRPSKAQMDALVELVRWLRARYSIALQDVHGHRDCCKTMCPGRNFPWAELIRRIR